MQPGEAIFQGAGLPHAYLEGQNVELMANSDNVLRGGLTPKHIDVPGLLKHISFVGTEPNILYPQASDAGEINYPLPVEDFAISAVRLQKGQEYKTTSLSSEILLVMQGSVAVNQQQQYKRGEAFVVLPDTEYTVAATADATLLYRAFVPLKAK